MAFHGGNIELCNFLIASLDDTTLLDVIRSPNLNVLQVIEDDTYDSKSLDHIFLAYRMILNRIGAEMDDFDTMYDWIYFCFDVETIALLLRQANLSWDSVPLRERFNYAFDVARQSTMTVSRALRLKSFLQVLGPNGGCLSLAGATDPFGHNIAHFCARTLMYGDEDGSQIDALADLLGSGIDLHKTNSELETPFMAGWNGKLEDQVFFVWDAEDLTHLVLELEQYFLDWIHTLYRAEVDMITYAERENDYLLKLDPFSCVDDVSALDALIMPSALIDDEELELWDLEVKE